MSWIMHSLWIHLCFFAFAMTCNVHAAAFQSHIRNHSWHEGINWKYWDVPVICYLRCVAQNSWRSWSHFSGRPPWPTLSKNNLLLLRNSRSKHWPQDDETWAKRRCCGFILQSFPRVGWLNDEVTENLWKSSFTSSTGFHFFFNGRLVQKEGVDCATRNLDILSYHMITP